MSEEIEIARVFTTLETRGGEDSAAKLADMERKAEQAQRNLDAINAKHRERLGLKPGQEYDAGDAFERDMKLGKYAVPSASSRPLITKTPRESAVESSKMMDLMGTASARSRMIEGMSGAGFEASQEQKEKSDAVKRATIEANDEAKAKKQLTKETGEVTKGFGILGKMVSGEGVTALRLAGLGGLAGGGAVATGAAAVGAARSFGGMANPAAAYRFDRAVADTEASLGRGLVPTLEYATYKTRQFGDILAGNENGISRFMSKLNQGVEFFSELSGFNNLAEKNKGLSLGMARQPDMGRWFKADELYKTMATTFLDQTPPKGNGREFDQEKQLATAREDARATRDWNNRVGQVMRGNADPRTAAPFGFGKPTGYNDSGQMTDAAGMPLSPFVLPAGSEKQMQAHMQAQGKSGVEINDAIRKSRENFMDTFERQFNRGAAAPFVGPPAPDPNGPQSRLNPPGIAPTGIDLERTVLM